MITEMIRTAFDNKINSFAVSQDIKTYLLTHERKNLCIDNLVKEIKLIEFKGAVKLDKPRIEMLAGNFAQAFCKITLNHQEQKAKTSLQKSIERKEHEENEFFEKLFEEEVEVVDRSKSL